MGTAAQPADPVPVWTASRLDKAIKEGDECYHVIWGGKACGANGTMGTGGGIYEILQPEWCVHDLTPYFA